MKLINPTDNEITVVFRGVPLCVKAKGTVEVSAPEAEFWLGIHPFLEIAETETVKKLPKKEVKKVEKKEVKEEK